MKVLTTEHRHISDKFQDKQVPRVEFEWEINLFSEALMIILIFKWKVIV